LPHHDVDENAFMVIFAITITIAMLPFINKLRIGNVELEVESAGYRPVDQFLYSLVFLRLRLKINKVYD